MTGNGTGDAVGDVFEMAREKALTRLEKLVGMVRACAALGVNRPTYYRRHRKSPAPPRPARARGRHPRALTPQQEGRVLDVLHSPEFADMAPAEIYAVLLDRGRLPVLGIDDVPAPATPRRGP